MAGPFLFAVMYGVDFEIVVTNTARTQRRSVPRECFQGCSGRIMRYGGYAEATFNTTLGLAQSLMEIGDCVEAWYLGYKTGFRVYRGYITAFAPSEENPPKLTLQTNGVAFWVSKRPINRVFSYPYGSVDVSKPFSDLATAFLVGPGGTIGPQNVPLIDSVVPEPIGTIFLSSLNVENQTGGEGIQQLVKAAGNLAVWGGDCDDSDNNRLYIRPFANQAKPDHVVMIPSKGVSAANGEHQAADVINYITFSGGAPTYPQLIHNGDFRLPVSTAPGQGNVIANPDFEDGAFAWTLAGGAAIATSAVSAPIRAIPYLGTYFLALGTGSATQIVPNGAQAITPGDNYTLIVPALQSNDGAGQAHGTITLTFKNGFGGGGGTISTFIYTFFANGGGGYTVNNYSFTMPAGTMSLILEIAWAFSGTPFGGVSGGIGIDSLELFDSSVVYQDGWQVARNPDCSINATNWVYPEAYGRGTYSLLLDVTTTLVNTDGHDVSLAPATGQITLPNPYNGPITKFSVLGATEVRYSVFAKSPAFSSQLTNTNFPGLALIIQWFDGGGSYISESRTYFAAPGGTISTWTYFELQNAIVPGNATQGWARVLLRSSGSLLVDAISIRDINAPSMNPSKAAVTISGVVIPPNTGSPTAYQADGNFVAALNCSDVYLNQTFLPAHGGLNPAVPTANTAGIAAPAPVPVLTVASPAAPTLFPATTNMSVVYTYLSAIGETTPGPQAAVNIAAGQAIDVASLLPLPAGATGVRYFVTGVIGPGEMVGAYFLSAVGDGSAIRLDTILNVPDYYFSQQIYGVQAGSVNDSSIIDINGACAVGDAVFRAQAAANERPVVSIVCDPHDTFLGPFWPGQSFRLEGETGRRYLPYPGAPIVQIDWEYDGKLIYHLQLQREAADETIATNQLILNLIKTQSRQQSSNSVGGSGRSNPTSNSVGGGSGLTVTDGVNTVSATTLKMLQGSVANPSIGEADYSLPVASAAVAGIIRFFSDTFAVGGGGPYATTHVFTGALALVYFDGVFQPFSAGFYTFPAAGSTLTLVGVDTSELQTVTVVYSY